MIQIVPDPHAGRAALDRDLEAHLKGASLADRGWARPNDLTLLVPMFATRDGAVDQYLLRLVFDHYPKCPPSAQFINPLTGAYSWDKDRMWVPQIEGHPAIHFHPNYANQGTQLICSSSTLEFYLVNHSVDQRHVWSPETMTFVTTLAAIRSGLQPQHYRGRHA